MGGRTFSINMSNATAEYPKRSIKDSMLIRGLHVSGHPVAILLLMAVAASACATRLPPETASGLVQRTGVPERPPDAEGTAIPPGVIVDDGLTQDEAVAVALWNNPDFRLQLADLGFARADLLEAGLLQNPVLSLLLPVGPKQLEATLRWPIEVLWERPRRVAAARFAADRVAAGLEQAGLTLVSDVKLAYVEYALAQDRLQLATQSVSELEQISTLMESRFEAGDVSLLEARTAAIDASRGRQDAVRARLDVVLRANELRTRLGLALDPREFDVVTTAAALEPCGQMAGLLEEALASRPDVRAAELGIEAAAARLGWERSRVVTITAVLDANGRGTEGFEMGPGIDIGAALFNRNDAGRARANAEIRRAAAAYVTARQRVATELRDATAQFQQASIALSGWRDTVLIPLEEQVQVANRAFAGGDVAYLFVLDMQRRLTDARLRTREAEADLARGLARIERAVGRRCGAAGREIARGF
jgi:cobalt-zinc-cadmium efflux system outer membrane protein